MTAPTVWLTPVNPPWPGIGFGLAGDAKLAPYSSGSYAWTAVERPRRKGFPEFTAVQLLTLQMPLILDGADGSIDIEPLCAAFDSWRYPAASTGQPPVLAVTGPVPQAWGNPNWVIQTVTPGAAIRRADQHRVQQEYDVTLLEYGTGDVASPAQAAQQRQAEATPVTPGLTSQAPPTVVPVGGQKLYVVHIGEVLTDIAAMQLGNWTRWVEIATLNNIRDPRGVTVGDVILLP